MRWARPELPWLWWILAGDLAEAVAGELAAKGIDAIAVTADVTQNAQIQKMVDAVVNKWGKLTIAVNNAGMGIGWQPKTLTKIIGIASPT